MPAHSRGQILPPEDLARGFGTMPALSHCRNEIYRIVGKKCLSEIGPKRLDCRGEVRIMPPRQADVHGRDRIKRHDDCFGTTSERIVTPSPLATIGLMASPAEVRSVTDG